MKRIVIVLLVVVASAMQLKAQEECESETRIVWGFQTNNYSTGWSKELRGFMLFPVSERWSMGCGSIFGWVHSDAELMSESMPFDNLKSYRKDWGITFNALYIINCKPPVRNSLMFQLSFAVSGVDFSAKDERAEHLESGENSDYISYEFFLYPYRQREWGPRFQIAPQISYAVDFSCFHFELCVGYEVIKLVRHEYLENPTTLTSDWVDCNTYYPSMTVNPFKEWECGRKIGGMQGFFVGLHFGVDVGALLKD